MRDAAIARPHRGCSTASLAWTSGGALYVTVVVKATVSLRHGAAAVLVPATPVLTEDRWVGRPHESSLLFASELLPFRPRVDVTASGHAQLPARGAGVVRLAVMGQGGWIDKSLEVHPLPRPGGATATRVQLCWEGTWADAENPIGVPPDGRQRAWILDPSRPGASAGLGPVGPRWPRRAAALVGADPRFLDTDAPRFPEGFDWQFFHAAPTDQQIAWLEGNEAIELSGLGDDAPTIVTRLPDLTAAAWAFAPWEVAEGQPLDLVADALTIDADRGLAHVVWRGTYPMLHEEWSLSQLSVLASVGASEEVEAAPLPAVVKTPPPPPPPPPPRTLAGLGPVAVASLFETNDDEDEGTRPLTRKELLAAMAAAGRALPFGPPKRRERTSEIELPPPSTAAPPSAGAPGAAPPEATRPLPLSQVLGPDGDHLTVTGDEEVLSQASVGALPPWLRGGSAASRDTLADLEEVTPEPDLDEETPAPSGGGPALGDEDTHVSDGEVPKR